MKLIPAGRTSGVVLAFMLVAFSTAAQPRPADRPARERFPAAAGRFGPGFERVMNMLTDEQRASLREAMESERDRMRELEEKIRMARMELFALSWNSEFNEETVRAKAMAAAKLEGELTVQRAKAFSRMRPALSGDQLRELRNSFPGMEGRGGGSRSEKSKGERDEHDLPPKDRVPAEAKPQK